MKKGEFEGNEERVARARRASVKATRRLSGERRAGELAGDVQA